MSAYDIVFSIVILCLIGLVALICWFLSFVFEKLDLITISNFFKTVKWIAIFILLTILGVTIAISIGMALAIAGKYIADFIFTLF